MNIKKLFLLVATALLLIGCGGGGGSSPVPHCSDSNKYKVTEANGMKNYTFEVNKCNDVTGGVIYVEGGYLVELTHNFDGKTAISEYTTDGGRYMSVYESDGRKVIDYKYNVYKAGMVKNTYLEDGNKITETVEPESDEYLIVVLEAGHISGALLFSDAKQNAKRTN